MKSSYVIEVKKSDVRPDQVQLLDEICHECYKLTLSNSYVFLHNDSYSLDNIISRLKEMKIRHASRPMSIGTPGRGVLER